MRHSDTGVAHRQIVKRSNVRSLHRKGSSMKDASSSKAKSQPDGIGSIADFSSWFNTYKQATEGWSELAANVVKGNMEFWQELMSFYQGRLQADAEVVKNMLACQNPTDFANVQREFISKTTNQYAGEAGKLAALSSSVMKNSTAALRSLSAAAP